MSYIDQLLAQSLKSRMGVNPLFSVGAPIAGNILSALVSNRARRRAQEQLNSLQAPTLPQFRANPILSQRIAQQQQLVDQPRMGYQRMADEQAGRQFERGRQVAANLGGGAGLAYMQGVSSNIADQQRKGLLNDAIMQQKNRSELDQLVNMRNQELAQERDQNLRVYQLAMEDFVNQRAGLQGDVSQQRSNIGASLGAILGDIPNYMTSINNYKSWKKMSEKEKSDAVAMAEEADRNALLTPDGSGYSYVPEMMGGFGVPMGGEFYYSRLFPDYMYGSPERIPVFGPRMPSRRNR